MSLQHRVHVLARSLAALPQEDALDGPTKRAMRSAAALVYNNLLLDSTVTLSTTLSDAVSLVDTLNALTQVVLCSSVQEKTRSIALSVVGSAMAAAAALTLSGGTGLLAAFDPGKLWQRCVDLARGAPCGFRPVFTARTVHDDLVVRSGGQCVVYKSRENQRYTQRTTSYAVNGILLDGSMGDVVMFSARLQRGFHTDTLGRYYRIGLVCYRASDTRVQLCQHPGDRSRQHASYTITDFFSDAIESCKPELSRHRLNWLSVNDSIVFGSGDVITVILHVRHRRISFERNGKTLGTLFRNLPSTVKVLFPVVELFNRDSEAKWMNAPDEVCVHARYALRAMLRCWGSELTPSLVRLIERASAEGDATALQALGADGDELNQVYRAPPRSGVMHRAQNVRLVRQEGRWAVVEDSEGSWRRVLGAALEPNNATDASIGFCWKTFHKELLCCALNLMQSLGAAGADHTEPVADSASPAVVQYPGALLRALRLLSVIYSSDRALAVHGLDLNEVVALAEVQELQARLVEHLLRLLRVIESLDIPIDVILSEAWNEILWSAAPSVPCDVSATPTTTAAAGFNSGRGCLALALPAEPSVVHRTPKKTDDQRWPSSSGASWPLYLSAEGLVEFCCPTCGERWSECRAAHEAPASFCILCDRLLQRHGRESPYVGWFTHWTDALPAPPPWRGGEEAAGSPMRSSPSPRAARPSSGAAKEDKATDPPVSVTFTPCADQPEWVEATGQCLKGEFSFRGRLLSETVVKGQVLFKVSAEPPSSDRDNNAAAIAMNAEWSCETCTFINAGGTTRCAMCAAARPGAVWSCMVCNYAYNPNATNLCATCGHMRFMRQGGGGDGGGGVYQVGAQNNHERACFCQICFSRREYRGFTELWLWQHCDHCGRHTRWLPQEKYSGVMEARLAGDGDSLEFALSVGGYSCIACKVYNSTYNAALLRRLVAEIPDEGGGGGSCGSGSGGEKDPIERYVPPLGSLSIFEQSRFSTSSPSDGSRTCIPSAMAFYASQLVFLIGPAINPDIFMDAAVLTRLRIYSEAWLHPLCEVSVEMAFTILRTCLGVLFEGLSCPHALRTVTATARMLMKTHWSLEGQRHYLLYGLALNAMRSRTPHTRGVCYTCIKELFEDNLGSLNTQCLGPPLRIQPIVAGQQQAMVFASLHGVSVGHTRTAIEAVSCLVRVIVCLQKSQPVPQVMESNMAHVFPYVVTLTETRLNEAGELEVGQVRGSVGHAPTQGGRYYYEVVLPANNRENTIIMGWGTLLHEHQNSGHHVGSDLHSWGFNCLDALRIMMGDQRVPVPQPLVAGDVVGSMLDLDAMMVCWSVNGEELLWVSVPAQGESEEIYPYVSAAVEPWGVEVRLGHTQFCPPDYLDFSPSANAMLWDQVSTAAPQSYAFYHELCRLLDSIAVVDLKVVPSVLLALASPQAQRALQQFLRVLALVEQASPFATPGGRDMSCLAPYVRHLSAISDLAVIVAHNYSLIESSPYLIECYHRARDLLFSAARWIIFESQIGGRPLFKALTPSVVHIDLQKAKSITEQHTTEEGSESERAPAAAAEDERALLTQSITGQLFSQIEGAPIYKNAIMFSVCLADNVTTDAGGVTRSVLSMMSDELNYTVRDHTRLDPVVPLFKLCGHSTVFTIVPNMERFMAEQHEPESERDCEEGAAEKEGGGGGGDGRGGRLYHRMLTWLGMLIGNLILCGTLKLHLSLPRLAWKFFTFEPATMADFFYDVDDTVRGGLADDAFLLNDEYFYSIPAVAARRTMGAEGARAQPSAKYRANSHGFSEPSANARLPSSPHLSNLSGLVATPAANSLMHMPYACMTPPRSTVDLTVMATGGSSISGCLDDLDEYAAHARIKEASRRRQEAEYALLHQYDLAWQCIRNGITAVLSQSAMQTIRWDDLQSRVCGIANITAEQVISCLDCTNISADLQTMLCDLLRNMTEQQRGLFLLFCSGQGRLPLPEKINVTCGSDPALLPTAHTCSPIALRLQPYKSLEEMQAKFKHCLFNAMQFGYV